MALRTDPRVVAIRHERAALNPSTAPFDMDASQIVDDRFRTHMIRQYNPEGGCWWIGDELCCPYDCEYFSDGSSVCALLCLPFKTPGKDPIASASALKLAVQNVMRRGVRFDASAQAEIVRQLRLTGAQAQAVRDALARASVRRVISNSNQSHVTPLPITSSTDPRVVAYKAERRVSNPIPIPQVGIPQIQIKPGGLQPLQIDMPLGGAPPAPPASPAPPAPPAPMPGQIWQPFAPVYAAPAVTIDASGGTWRDALIANGGPRKNCFYMVVDDVRLYRCCSGKCSEIFLDGSEGPPDWNVPEGAVDVTDQAQAVPRQFNPSNTSAPMLPQVRNENPLVGSVSMQEWAGYFARSAVTGLVLGAAIGWQAARNEGERTSMALKIGAVTAAVFLALPAITMIRGDMIPAVDCDDSFRNMATKVIGNAMLGLLYGGAIGAAVPSLTFGSETVSRKDVINGGVLGAGVLAAGAVLGAGIRKLMPPAECAPII